MRVAIIAEDFRKDQFLLKPICEAMMASLGRPSSRVVVLTDPAFRGVGDVLRRERMQRALDLNKGMFDLFLLIVDRDGDDKRHSAITEMERWARSILGPKKCFLGALAWQEVEVWALAPHRGPWKWADLRRDPHPKERYFEPFVAGRGLGDEPAEGRVTLGREAGKAYDRVRKLCPQDLGVLESRVARFLATGACPED